MSLKYNKNLIPRAKELRKNATKWEKKLWHYFLAEYPVRFQRQKTIDNYIADFYCAKAKLVIELDGGGHREENQKGYDVERTKVLEAYNLKVIRFENEDVWENFSAVCESIDEVVKERMSAPSVVCR